MQRTFNTISPVSALRIGGLEANLIWNLTVIEMTKSCRSGCLSDSLTLSKKTSYLNCGFSLAFLNSKSFLTGLTGFLGFLRLSGRKAQIKSSCGQKG
jgi:hypothetical protein